MISFRIRSSEFRVESDDLGSMIGYGSFSVVHPCKEVRQECNTVIKVPVPVRLEDSFGGRGFYSSEYQQGMYLKETSEDGDCGEQKF